MSFKYMAKAADFKTGSSTKKLILLLLADRCNDNGVCYPSHTTIANDAEVSRRTVIRLIKEMEVDGVLTVKQRGKNGNKTSNIYTLMFDLDVTLTTFRCDTMSHKPIKEPICSNENIQAFEILWKDYTLTFLKQQNRGGGSKAKAKAKYLELNKKYSYEDIYKFADNHCSQSIGHKDLERLLTLDNIKQFFEDVL